MDQIVLSCEVPSGSNAGDSFHIKAPDGRYFEVKVPENARMGESINVVVNSINPIVKQHQQLRDQVLTTADLDKSDIINGDSNVNNSNITSADGTVAAEQPSNLFADSQTAQSIFSAVKSSVNTIYSQAKKIDESYSISERISTNVKAVDDKYDITNKIKAVDDRYDLSSKLTVISDSAITAGKYAGDAAYTTFTTVKGHVITAGRRIDEKYVVTPVLARLLTVGCESILSAYNKAVEFDRENNISQSVTETASSAAKAVYTFVTSRGSSSSANASDDVDHNAFNRTADDVTNVNTHL